MSDPVATAEEERRRWRRQRGFVLTDASSSVTTEAAYLVRRVGSAPASTQNSDGTPISSDGCASPQSDSFICVQRSRSVFNYHGGSERIEEEQGTPEDSSFRSPVFVGKRRLSVHLSAGSSCSTPSGTPDNPFERCMVPLIGRPFVDRAMFDVMMSPSEEMSASWTVEQLSELYPVEIDTSRAVAAETNMEDPKERLLQARIDRYFREFHAIVTPSPDTKGPRAEMTPGGSIISRGFRRKACSVQTEVSIPPADLSPKRMALFSISKVAGNDDDFFEAVGDVCGKGSANTTLDDSCASMASIVSWNPRRKLFGGEEPPSVEEEDGENLEGVEPEKRDEGVQFGSPNDTVDLSDLTNSQLTSDEYPSLGSFHPGGRTGYRHNFQSTMLEAPSAFRSPKYRSALLPDQKSLIRRHVENACAEEELEDGVVCAKSGQTPRKLSFELAESGVQADEGKGEFFSSVNLEETRAEFFSDDSESDKTQSGRNTPVAARDKSILRYAAVLERQVGTQTDISWPVENLPVELAKVLEGFRAEVSPVKLVSTPVKTPFAVSSACQTPDQGWLSKMLLLRSSSPKSFERRKDGLHADVESSPNYVIVKDSEMVRPGQKDVEFDPLDWKQVSPGTLSIVEMEHSTAGPSRFQDNDAFEKAFKTPQKRLSAVVAFEAGPPDLSPIALDDEDGSSDVFGDPDSPIILRRNGPTSGSGVLRGRSLRRSSTFMMEKENDEPRMSLLPVLCQTGTESSFGNDDTGYQSYHPSKSSATALSFASVANSTCFGPSCDSMPERDEKNPLAPANRDLDGHPAPIFHRSSSLNAGSEIGDHLSPPRRYMPVPGGYKRRSVERNLQSVDDSVLSDVSTQKALRIQRRVSALGCESAGSSPYMGESKRHWGRNASRRPSTTNLDTWRSQPSVLLDESASLDTTQASSLETVSSANGGDRKSVSPFGDASLSLNFSGIFR